LDDLFRRAFSVLSRRGTAGVAEIAEDLAIPMEAAHDALESLLARRLVQFHADRYAVPAP
jgi:DNA-binding IclR family transcriptional regulator